MLLLRPWREPYLAIRSWIGDPSKFCGKDPACMWMALYETYVQWRAKLSNDAAPYFSRDPRTWRPPPKFGGDEWWTCRVHNIVENMDMAFASPGKQASKVPDVHGLPEGLDYDSSDLLEIMQHSFAKRLISECADFK